MKRLIAGAAIVAAATGMLAARPVLADGSSPVSDPRSSATVGALVNPVLALVPSPPGWAQRHVCFGDTKTNQAWCLFFPFPF
ncbi:MAG TPA: hypothetical protein VHC63_15350 [Acidimicrobiales bacterium]|nr:hypothetical protein [Acidimicrobiales bacterium]